MGEGHNSCPNEGWGAARSVTNCIAIAEHPEGIAAAPMPYKRRIDLIGAAARVWHVYLPTQPERDHITYSADIRRLRARRTNYNLIQANET